MSEALQRSVLTSKLTWLALGSNNITNEGADHLAALLSTGWSSIDDEDEDGPDSASCPLQSLGLGGNLIGDAGAASLSRALQNNTSEPMLTVMAADHWRTYTHCPRAVVSQFIS